MVSPFVWLSPDLGNNCTTKGLLIHLHSFQCQWSTQGSCVDCLKVNIAVLDIVFTFPFLGSFSPGWCPLKCSWPDSTVSNVCSRERGYTSSWSGWAEGRGLKHINPIWSHRPCVECFQYNTPCNPHNDLARRKLLWVLSYVKQLRLEEIMIGTRSCYLPKCRGLKDKFLLNFS